MTQSINRYAVSQQSVTITDTGAYVRFFDHLDHIKELEARITLALRLHKAGCPGYISLALQGDKLEKVAFAKDATLLDFLEAVEREDLIKEV